MRRLFSPFSVTLLLVNILIAYLFLNPQRLNLKSFLRQGTSTCPGEALAPLEPREWTLEELREYDGKNSQRILVCLDWRVFDVSKERKLYGPGGSYEKLAGKDATRSLAAGKIFDYSAVQSFDDYLDLTLKERATLNEWVDYYYQKYSEVGIVVRVKDERFVDPEDIFSAPGDPPNGGIFSDINMENNF